MFNDIKASPAINFDYKENIGSTNNLLEMTMLTSSHWPAQLNLQSVVLPTIVLLLLLSAQSKYQ